MLRLSSVFRRSFREALEARAELRKHSEHLFGGDHHQAEGQVSRHLDRATHPDMPASVFFMQMGVHPLDRATFVVAQRFRRGEPDLLAPARIAIDNRHMAETGGHIVDFLGVVCGIGQIVEVGNALGRHLGQWDRDLAVVQAGGGEDEAHGDVAIEHVQMRLVSTPALHLVLTVLLATPIAGRRQIDEISRQIAFELPLQPSGFRGRGHGLVFGPPTVLLRRSGFFFRLVRRLFAPMNRGGVAADVAGKFIAVVGLEQRFVNLLRPHIASEGLEGA